MEKDTEVCSRHISSPSGVPACWFCEGGKRTTLRNVVWLFIQTIEDISVTVLINF